MNEQVLDTIKELEIKKAPEQNTLEAANQNYTKKQLAHFIERHDLDIAKSWKKDEIVEPLTEWMKKAGVELLNSDEELNSYYSQDVMHAEENLDIYSDNLSEADLERVLLLLEHGLAHNVDGQLWTADETESIVTDEVESVDKGDSSEEDAPKEKAVETKSKQSSKKPIQSTSPDLSTQEKLAQHKQLRLKYLKKQAKKKKRK